MECVTPFMIKILPTQKTQSCSGNCCFSTQSCAFLFSITAFHHNIMEKEARNFRLLVKTCAFSYTQRLEALGQRLLSIFDRNISFLVHIQSKKILVAKWNDFMSPSLSAEMMEINLPAFIMKIFSISLVSLHMIHSFYNLYSYYSIICFFFHRFSYFNQLVLLFVLPLAKLTSQ